MTSFDDQWRHEAIIDRSLANIFSDYEPEALPSEEKLYFSSLFAPQMPPLTQRIARLGYQGFSDIAPPSLRRAILKPLRGIRNTTKKRYKSVEECSFNKLVNKLDQQGLTRKGYFGSKSVICLSYDVDQKVGYCYLDEIVEMLSSFDLKATFNILTDWEYQIDWPKLNTLNASDNFEIGLHGAKHDIALGYKKRNTIRREIEAALDCVPFKLASYRAPALCMSSNLMEEIISQEFLVDSSMPMTSMYYKSVESCFPYPIINSQSWEFPVTVQDSSMFLDLKLSEDESFIEIKKIIDDIILIGGVGILNLHPYIAVQYKNFHKRILTYIAQKDEAIILTQQELYGHLEN